MRDASHRTIRTIVRSSGELTRSPREREERKSILGWEEGRGPTLTFLLLQVKHPVRDLVCALRGSAEAGASATDGDKWLLPSLGDAMKELDLSRAIAIFTTTWARMDEHC